MGRAGYADPDKHCTAIPRRSPPGHACDPEKCGACTHGRKPQGEPQDCQAIFEEING